MSCTAQNSLTTSGSTFAKPVFAPGLKTIAEASSLAYVQAVGESYTAQGAPRRGGCAAPSTPRRLCSP